MPKSKLYLFKKTEVQLANLLKALSHPARIAILSTLSKRTECVCGEVVNVIPLAQATVSQHLKALKSAGLISGEFEGPKSSYCLNWKNIEELSSMLEDLVTTLKNNQQRCC
ncbi:MAG: metalloregulator ArsR/SmtB family transcription factor [Bacteroidota bacterium]